MADIDINKFPTRSIKSSGMNSVMPGDFILAVSNTTAGEDTFGGGEGFKIPIPDIALMNDIEGLYKKISETSYVVQAAYGSSGTGGININSSSSYGYYIITGKCIHFRGLVVLSGSPQSYFHIILPFNYSLKSIDRSVSVSASTSSTGTIVNLSGAEFINGDRFNTHTGSSQYSYYYFSGYYFID